MNRRPLLMAAALGVAILPIVLVAWPDRPGQQEVREDLRTFNVEAPPPPDSAPVSMPSMAARTPAPPPPPPPPEQGGETAAPYAGGPVLPEVAPRVAYSYGFRFRVPADALAAVQERHLQLCLSMGQARCRIVSMRRSESRPASAPPPRDHGYGGGQLEPEAPAASLEIQVAALLADEFGRRLTVSTGEAGGETVDRQIGADDVSREMVDSEARIRTRETLIRRLSALLATRSGNIEQAVQAERAINAAQEELDAARTWLAETRGRVAMSKIAIFYEPAGAIATPAERDPIGKALAQAASIATRSVAVLLFILSLTLPWALLAFLIAYFVRRYRLAHSLPSE